MKTPPLLLGSALLFWGWQAEQLILSLAMALILEGSRAVDMRWEITRKDFNRVSDFCSIILVVMMVYFFASYQSAKIILTFLKLLPAPIFLLVLFQVYGTSDKVDIGALFLMVRRRQNEKGISRGPYANLTYPYFVLCIISASAANIRDHSFFAGLILLSAWALWSIRSRRFPLILWAAIVLTAGTGGYAGHIGLHGLQIFLEKKGDDFFNYYYSRDRDPFKSITAIGDIGTLKLSDRIRFRVEPDPNTPIPLLLRETSYNVYRSSNWFALHSRFTEMTLETDGTTWSIRDPSGTSHTLTISSSLKRGRGMLKIPNRTFRISNLPAVRVMRNLSEDVKVEGGPGLATYTAAFGGGATADNPPNKGDLAVPKKEKMALEKLSKDLKLTIVSPLEAINRIETFFQNNFDYSLVLSNKGPPDTPLANFLFRSRTGHCEYFATATVLLLRTAGIPARYASGYSVHEFNSMENQYVVRARHAHSWALVYLNGSWQDLDTTPASWINIESDGASVWQPVSDLFSYLSFKFSKWRWEERDQGLSRHIWWLLVPLLVIFGRRLYVKRSLKQAGSRQLENTIAGPMPGADSEFYKIEKRLNELGFSRNPWETYSSWFTRLAVSRTTPVPVEDLFPVLAFHYRYRFDPEGLSGDEQAEMISGANKWLKGARNM